MSPRTLGEHLRLTRIDRNPTQAQVASLLGVGYQTVVKWEHNVSGIGPQNQASIVAFMGYDPVRRNLKSTKRPK